MIKQLISNVEDKISQRQSENNFTKVKNLLNTMNSEEGLNNVGFWKVRRKLCPRRKEPPIAKRDESGNLISGTEALKMLYLNTYKERLKHREIDPKFSDIYLLKTELWRNRLKIVEKVKSDSWSLACLDRVLSDLKNNKAADPTGVIQRRLFRN